MFNNIETFISVHDQDLILNLEKNRIFRNLKNYKYLFLGIRPVDKLNDIMDKVIVVRDLPYNIEDKKCLYDYTGLWALAHNEDIVTSSHIAVIQYDCFVDNGFISSIKNAFKKNSNCFINFQPQPINNEVFLKDMFARSLKKACKDVYNLDLEEIKNNLIEKGDVWFQAGGTFACSLENLKKYIDWVEPLLPQIEKDSMAAHNIERTVKFFCVSTGLEEVFIPDYMEHVFNFSHDQAYNNDKMVKYYRNRYKQYVNGELFKEYRMKHIVRFLRNIFSIKNCANYKVLTVLGIKIKFKRK